MCASGNRETNLSIAAEPAEPENLPAPFFSWLGKSLERADVGRYPRRREDLQKRSLPEGKFQHVHVAKTKQNKTKQKNKKTKKKLTSVAVERVRRKTFQHLLPQGNSAWD